MNILSQLQLLQTEEAKQNQSLYSAGDYWRTKTIKISRQLAERGLQDFRGYNSGVGTSFCDNIVTDLRNEVYHGFRGLAYQACRLQPMSRLIDSQVEVVKRQHKDTLTFKQIAFETSLKVTALLEKFRLENTVDFGCVDKVTLRGKEISCHYLELLNTHSVIAEKVVFSAVKSVMEIGGGFGANIHILLQNYPNIRKVYYLDMAPNLIVGSNYLKSLYKDSVVTFRSTQPTDKITFKDNDDLEILCIAPWQVENINSQIDYFHNSHSFVEMPIAIAKNYINHVKKLLKSDSQIGLVTYDQFDEATTFNPKEFHSFFEFKLYSKEEPHLLEKRKNSYFLK